MQAEQRIADIVAGDEIAGRERVGPQEFSQGFVESLQASQSARTSLQRRNVIGPPFVATIEASQRLLEPLRVMKQQTALIGRVPVARIELEHTLIGQHGLGLATESIKGAGEPKPGLRIIRLELDGLVENLEGFLEPPALLEGGSEICEIIRLGILPDGAPDPLDGMIILTGAKADHSPIRCSAPA